VASRPASITPRPIVRAHPFSGAAECSPWLYPVGCASTPSRLGRPGAGEGLGGSPIPAGSASHRDRSSIPSTRSVRSNAGNPRASASAKAAKPRARHANHASGARDPRLVLKLRPGTARAITCPQLCGLRAVAFRAASLPAPYAHRGSRGAAGARHGTGPGDVRVRASVRAATTKRHRAREAVHPPSPLLDRPLATGFQRKGLGPEQHRGPRQHRVRFGVRPEAASSDRPSRSSSSRL